MIEILFYNIIQKLTIVISIISKVMLIIMFLLCNSQNKYTQFSIHSFFITWFNQTHFRYTHSHTQKNETCILGHAKFWDVSCHSSINIHCRRAQDTPSESSRRKHSKSGLGFSLSRSARPWASQTCARFDLEIEGVLIGAKKYVWQNGSIFLR